MMKTYLPWLLLAVLAIVYLVYNQRFFKKINTPSTIQEISVPSKYLDREVKVWVYLPPNYLEAIEPLPVLYMHDGQNLFDEDLSFAGEWFVDEALDSLYTEEKLQLVVVGIENGGERRLMELTPYVNKEYGGGKAMDYLNFIEEELFPVIHAKYNVSQERKDRGIMGSSLGGLISFYAAFKKSDIYSKFGVYSPSFWINPEIYDLAKTKKLKDDGKMILMIGDKENDHHLDVIKMQEVLDQSQDIKVESTIIPGGEHNEKFWAEHIKNDMYTLFKKDT